jgi:hypothetical protein
MCFIPYAAAAVPYLDILGGTPSHFQALSPSKLHNTQAATLSLPQNMCSKWIGKDLIIYSSPITKDK